MPATPITALPAPPLRSQSPTTFSGTAETFVEALPSMVTEMNAFIAYLNALALSGVSGSITSTALTMATSRLLGRVSASTGAIEELTLSQVLDLVGSAAQGDILYRGASGWARLAAGTSGHVLQTQGADANPQWAAPSAGSSTFSALTDGPGALSGKGNQRLAVNPAGTALEYFKTVDQAPDPARQWFGPSGVTVETFTAAAGGDQQILWDGSQFVNIYWKQVTGSPYVRCYYRTAPTLHGPWSGATQITSLANYHKPFVLVDEYGAPVQIGGNYHAYAVYYNGSLGDKEIYHFTASSLTGTWTLGSKVIAKGTGSNKDAYNSDTPFALYKDGTIYLWYMGAPTSSVSDYATYGYATRILRATATNADGPFTKSSADVLTPSTSAAWDYGWLGGVQILRRACGGYMLVYNAGDTRPSSAGDEPTTSRVGYAYADSLDGPWTKDTANPYFTPTSWPSNQPEATNIWRCYLAYDKTLGSWFAFYNTASVGAGGEKITYGIAGVYDYFDQTGGSPYVIQTLTTSVATVTNSRVNVTPGVYRVRYAYNIGDLSTAKPALDVDLTLRFNGSGIKPASREFIGSYNYENRDVILEYIVLVTSTGYFDCSVQVTGGTPTGSSQIRRGRVNVERVRAL